MPIYEYKCLQCGYQFEHLQKINEEDLSICPKCKAPNLTRLISNSSFQLKGSGWYATGYQNKDNKPAKKDAS